MSWKCAYCPKVNPDSALCCGQGVWDGCGAARPTGKPVARSAEKSAVRLSSWCAVHDYSARTSVGMSARDFVEAWKLGIGHAFLPAIKGCVALLTTS